MFTRSSCLAFLLSTLACPLASRAETYDSWAALHFTNAERQAGLASPVRDADLDGCSNVLEYLGGTDPRAVDSRLEIEAGPDPGTVRFTVATDREDIVYAVLQSGDLETWQEAAEPLCIGTLATWSLQGQPFVKVGVKRRVGWKIDSDLDGLDDLFEESLVARDLTDAITSIGSVHPGDDFDGDGVPNRDEEENRPEPPAGGSFTAPPPLSETVLTCALQGSSISAPTTLEVHTPLQD